MFLWENCVSNSTTWYHCGISRGLCRSRCSWGARYHLPEHLLPSLLLAGDSTVLTLLAAGPSRVFSVRRPCNGTEHLQICSADQPVFKLLKTKNTHSNPERAAMAWKSGIWLQCNTVSAWRSLEHPEMKYQVKSMLLKSADMEEPGCWKDVQGTITEYESLWDSILKNLSSLLPPQPHLWLALGKTPSLPRLGVMIPAILVKCIGEKKQTSTGKGNGHKKDGRCLYELIPWGLKERPCRVQGRHEGHSLGAAQTGPEHKINQQQWPRHYETLVHENKRLKRCHRKLNNEDNSDEFLFHMQQQKALRTQNNKIMKGWIAIKK